MDIVKTICLSCKDTLEFPREFDNVICAGCGAAYRVQSYQGAINLTRIEREPGQIKATETGANGGSELKIVEMRLAELDELIANAAPQLEEVKDKEQSAPLQLGCAVFGIFSMAILVLAFYATVAHSYFGGWLFYLTIAAVIALGLIRLRGKIIGSDEIRQLRAQRALMQEALTQLETERRGVEQLKERLESNARDTASDDDDG